MTNRAIIEGTAIMKPAAFEKSAKDKKADKKHGGPEGGKKDAAQDKKDGKGMPSKPFMKKSGRGR
jgi:hypothetical protein